MSTSRRQAVHYQSSHYPLGNPGNSPRSSYPSFLSIQESVQLQLRWGWHGLYDAFRWNIVISTVAGDAEIRANVYKSMLLNSLSLISIYAFDLLLLPLIENQQNWFHRHIGWFYHVLWLLPVVGVAFYLNNSWCSIIAKRIFILQRGNRAPHQDPITYSGILTAFATSAYRVLMVFNSVLVSFSLRNIPYVGPIIGFIFLCWVDSYYCFEFLWIAGGLSLSRRIRHFEERWAYYLAFGFPSAALCSCGAGLANGAIFGLIFPMYIILAMNSRPMPSDPYNPLPSPSQGTDSDAIRHPSPFVPIRIPVFGLVIWLNDSIVKVFSVGFPRKHPNGRSRAFSDAGNSVEDGETVELKGTPRPVRLARDRISIGRRKLD